jgi:lipopolysaccharide transport system ATP-binding protein
MSSNLAIRAEHLCKSFQIYNRPIDRLKQMLVRNRRRYYRDFAALHDVNFELKKGEVLGLVGRNGAGKSTLLQLICGTLTPTEGQVHVNGRVAALLELGAGFNPDFSGRENVYLNASILGLSKEEIDQRYDAIVDFSGIGDFIEQPVRTYSSGMYVRLAFSIATSVDPDILVIDEALSVGDGAFARKSFDRIMKLRDAGATILFCSHSLYQVEALCNRTLWLDKGTIQQMGDPSTVIAAYQTFLDRDNAQAPSAPVVVAQASDPSTPSNPTTTSNSPTGHAHILYAKAAVNNHQGTSLQLQCGIDTLSVTVAYASDPQLPAPVVAVTINTPDGRFLASSSTQSVGLVLDRDSVGRGSATIYFPRIPLLKGEYTVGAYLLSENGIHVYDSGASIATLHFTQVTLEQGIVSLQHTWQCHSQVQSIGV